MFTQLDFANSFTPEKYLNECLSKFVNEYFNSINCIEILPSICLEELIYSAINKITSFNFYIGLEKKIILNSRLSINEVETLLKPYFDVITKILTNKRYFDSNDECVKYFVSSIVDNKIINFDKRKINDLLTSFYALEELKRRDFTFVNKIWDYSISLEEKQLVHWKSDYFDSKKFGIAIRTFFDNLSVIIDESLNLIPIKIKNTLSGHYAYQIEKRDLPFPNHSIKIGLLDKAEKLCFEEQEIDFYNGKFLSWQWSSWVEEVFEDETPYYIVCREILLEFICNQFDLKSDGIKLQYQKFKLNI